jgi:hypothetical protein
VQESETSRGEVDSKSFLKKPEKFESSTWKRNAIKIKKKYQRILPRPHTLTIPKPYSYCRKTNCTSISLEYSQNIR